MYLRFDDLYTKADSPAISLDSLAPENSDATVLSGIRELSARRNQSVCRECCKFEPENIEKHVRMFEKYLSLLQQFILAANTRGWSLELESNNSDNTTNGFRWSSPLAALSSSSCAPLPHLLVEFSMALCFYAAALQENAWKILQNSTSSIGGSKGDVNPSKNTEQLEEDSAASLTAAAALLRKSAGVYAHIKNTLIPEIEKKETIQLSTSSPLQIPLELNPTAVEVLETIALAQAQGVAAERAERKGASPTAIAAVHRGAVDLYESAAAKLKNHSSSQSSNQPLPPASERCRMWLALSAEIHAIKALRAQARIFRHDGELGQASACLKDAILRIQRCLNVVATAKEETAWRRPFSTELQILESVHAAYEKERIVVYVQAVASIVPPPPPGKVIITPALVEFLETSLENRAGPVAAERVTEHYFI